jgi:hypothetical protein
MSCAVLAGLFGALRYRKSHNNQSVDAFEAFVGVQSLAHHVVAKALFRQQQFAIFAASRCGVGLPSVVHPCQ